MQCDEPSIKFQWGPEKEEQEILSILWAEEKALVCQEEEDLEDLEEEYLPHSPHLKPQSNLPPIFDSWEHPYKSLMGTEWKLMSSLMNSNTMFGSTVEYQDSSPQ